MMSQKQVQQAAKQIKMVVLDIDGTSINSSGELTKRTHRSIQALVEKGYLVVPATGRGSYRLLEDTLRLRGGRYVISANGAVITDCKNGIRLWERLIPCKEAATLASDLLEEGNCVYLHRNDIVSTHIMACPSKTDYARLRRPDWPPMEQVLTQGLDDYILQDGRDVIKIGLCFTRPDGFTRYESLQKKMHSQLNCFRVDNQALEFTNGNASKGAALRELAQLLGLAPQEICAIGDNGNDIEMLEYAGLGVAMQNATAEARTKADYITESNDADGVALFAERFLFCKKDS